MKYNLQRKNYLSWDATFMIMSLVIAKRSKDPSTQVGACIVGSDHRILSLGYNGAPNGFLDAEFPWNREGNKLDTKYPYVVHAERNAILNFRGNKKDLEGSKLYVSLFPCNECAKEIIQTGINEVIYDYDKYADLDEYKAAKLMFDKCKVKYRCITDEVRKEIKIFKL